MAKFDFTFHYMLTVDAVIDPLSCTRIWSDASLSGLKHFFVEQGGNFTHDPFRSVADSAAYVKRVLLK